MPALILIFFVLTLTVFIYAVKNIIQGSPSDKVLQSKDVKNKDYFEKLYTLYQNKYRRNSYRVSENLKEILLIGARLLDKAKASEQKYLLEQVDYELEDMFKKLHFILDENHYLEVVNYPNYWDDSDLQIKQIEAAVDSAKDNLEMNMRRLNARKELDFKVAINSLTITSNDTMKSIYRNQEESKDNND